MRTVEIARRLSTPAFLKLELFCSGLRVDPALSGACDAAGHHRTRAGLGSGLELSLSDGVRVNAPVHEPFAAASPLLLTRTEAGTGVMDTRTPEIPPAPAAIVPRPRFYDQPSPSGRPMHRIGVLQGTVLSVYIGRVCDFWRDRPSRQCRFCATGLNVGVAEELEKADGEIIALARAARAECGVTFIHFNSGEQGGGESDRLLPLIGALKRETGLLIGVQCPPQADPAAYDRLRRAGADHLSFCVEFGDSGAFEQICPGKAAVHGQPAYFAAIEQAARRFPRGAVSGELIAGIEPLGATREAIDRICAAGAFPTVCVFRPLTGSLLDDRPPPPFEEMAGIFDHLYRGLVRHRIPVGVAPGIDVSIIVTPKEARAFAAAGPRPAGWRSYHALNALRTVAARLYLRTRGLG